MKPRKWLFAMLLLAGTAAHAATGAPAAPAKLVITGSSTMAPLVTEMARSFEKLHPTIKVEVNGGGSGKGISDLRSGASNISMTSRLLLDSERDLFSIPIARDGVAFLVHASNPVKQISANQLVGVLTGKITNWKSLGGKDAAVTLIWGGKGQGTSELLLDHLKLSDAELRSYSTIVDNAERIRQVERNVNAIAPNSIGQSERATRAGSPVSALAYEHVTATPKTIRNGSYALSRPLMLVTRGLPQGAEKRFIDFALSGHVADLFAKYDFVAYQD